MAVFVKSPPIFKILLPLKEKEISNKTCYFPSAHVKYVVALPLEIVQICRIGKIILKIG